VIPPPQWRGGWEERTAFFFRKNLFFRPVGFSAVPEERSGGFRDSSHRRKDGLPPPHGRGANLVLVLFEAEDSAYGQTAACRYAGRVPLFLRLVERSLGGLFQEVLKVAAAFFVFLFFSVASGFALIPLP